MTESQIERAAEQVLTAHGLTGLPVDPLAVARLENIRLAPGSYAGAFEGRIEYRRSGDRGHFYLYYAGEEAGHRPASRVRFSVAHELGHFFLPTHRRYLLSGRWFGRRSGFLSVRRLEREADYFAGALLMPRERFVEHAQGRGGGRCGLADLAGLARDVFKTSLTSTAIRYAQLNFAACCVVLSERGRVLFAVRSEEMKRLGLCWLGGVPGDSVTAGVVSSTHNGSTPNAQGAVDAGVWFGAWWSGRLREEARVLGPNGRVLTLLVADEGNGHD